MRSVDSLLDEYGESHRNPANKTIHWICVPLIVWSVIALIWVIPSPAIWLNWAVVAIVAAQIYYFALSPRLGIGLLGYNVLSLALCWAVELYVPVPLWAVALTVFVAAWIGQFIGHQIEGKKPSFFKDIVFLLIGPAWLMSFLYRRLGLSY